MASNCLSVLRLIATYWLNLMSGEDAPAAIFPSCVGRPRQDCPIVQSFPHRVAYVGNQLDEEHGTLDFNYPIERGIITDWSNMQKVWDYTFDTALNVDPSDHAVLLTDAPLNSKENRENMAEIMFETSHTPALLIAMQAMLALAAYGRRTGVIVDCGDSITNIVPIYDNTPVQEAITQIDVAGRDLTAYMAKVFNSRGHTFSTPAELNIVRDIKEKLAYVAEDFEKEGEKAQNNAADVEKSYQLPDGQAITVGEERFHSVEGLFNPTLLGLDGQCGLHQATHDAIMKCPAEMHNELFWTIIPCGGTAALPGLSTRMRKEMIAVASDKEVNVKAQPNSLAWVGGSMVSYLSTSSTQLAISQKDYKECGASILHRKLEF